MKKYLMNFLFALCFLALIGTVNAAYTFTVYDINTSNTNVNTSNAAENGALLLVVGCDDLGDGDPLTTDCYANLFDGDGGGTVGAGVLLTGTASIDAAVDNISVAYKGTDFGIIASSPTTVTFCYGTTLASVITLTDCVNKLPTGATAVYDVAIGSNEYGGTDYFNITISYQDGIGNTNLDHFESDTSNPSNWNPDAGDNIATEPAGGPEFSNLSVPRSDNANERTDVIYQRLGTGIVHGSYDNIGLNWDNTTLTSDEPTHGFGSDKFVFEDYDNLFSDGLPRYISAVVWMDETDDTVNSIVCQRTSGDYTCNTATDLLTGVTNDVWLSDFDIVANDLGFAYCDSSSANQTYAVASPSVINESITYNLGVAEQTVSTGDCIDTQTGSGLTVTTNTAALASQNLLNRATGLAVGVATPNGTYTEETGITCVSTAYGSLVNSSTHNARSSLDKIVCTDDVDTDYKTTFWSSWRGPINFNNYDMVNQTSPQEIVTGRWDSATRNNGNNIQGNHMLTWDNDVSKDAFVDGVATSLVNNGDNAVWFTNCESTDETQTVTFNVGDSDVTCHLDAVNDRIEISGLLGSGGGEGASPVPEFPMYGMVLVALVVVVATFFLMRRKK
jgi:hypothetical protein